MSAACGWGNFKCCLMWVFCVWGSWARPASASACKPEPSGFQIGGRLLDPTAAGLVVGRSPSVWRLGFRCLCAVSRRWIHRPVIASAAPSKAASSEGHRGDWDPKSREDREENLASGRLPSFVLLWQLQAGETSGRDLAERERAKTCTWSCTGPSAARSPAAHPLGWWGA